MVAFSTAAPAMAPPEQPRLRRQRSSFCCCLSSHHSFCDPDFLPPPFKDCLLFPSHSVSSKDDPPPGSVTWWHDSWRLLGSRRKVDAVGHPHWVDDAVDEPYYRPPRWRLLLRKIRAQTRKMNCTKPAPPGFHYDSLSYAMNFDDGCWHQGDSQPQGLHPSRFSGGPILVESVSFKGSS